MLFGISVKKRLTLPVNYKGRINEELFGAANHNYT